MKSDILKLILYYIGLLVFGFIILNLFPDKDASFYLAMGLIYGVIMLITQ